MYLQKAARPILTEYQTTETGLNIGPRSLLYNEFQLVERTLPMVGRRLALPLSPPASPLMTDRRPQFDQSILNWASAVEYDSNTDHHWQTDRSRLVHVSAGTESSSTTALQPPIGSVSTYGAAAHRSNLSHNPNPGCNQQYGSYVTPLQRPLVTLERYAGLSHPTNGQSTTTSKPEPAALTQTLGYEKGADIDNADVELSDADEEEESGLRPVTVAELRAHNRRLKRFRLVMSFDSVPKNNNANEVDKDLPIARLAT